MMEIKITDGPRDYKFISVQTWLNVVNGILNNTPIDGAEKVKQILNLCRNSTILD